MADELVSFSTSSWSEWEGIELETQGKESPLDDPFESETTGEQADSSSDWASFNDSTFPSPPIPCTSSIDHINVETIFKTCFEVPVDSNKETTATERMGPLSVETKFLQKLHKSTVSLSLSSWSHSLFKDQLLLTLLTRDEDCKTESEQFISSDLELSEFLPFDWSQDEGERDSDSNSDGVSFSPDLMQGLFRTCNGGIDSPVEFEYDHDKATIGLSMLLMEELIQMRDEMLAKVNKQSEELISLLQSRDILIRETDTKNKFIAALLRVQDQKHASLNGSISTSGSSIASSHSVAAGVNQNGGGSGTESRPRHRRMPSDPKRALPTEAKRTGSSEERPRSRTRSRSQTLSQNLSKSLSLVWSKGRRPSVVDEKNNEAYLQVVVPYRPAEVADSYTVPLLKHWIAILKAMAERSPHLPNLISTYLQSEVINTD